MKIISFIEDWQLIKKILKHPLNIHIDYADSQIPSCEDDLCCDPDYPTEMYAS